MTLIRSLRQPDRKPADVDALDRRLDAVEERLRAARRRRLQIEYDAMRRK